ncbi:MAG: hypothetical protein C0614_03910 [Desulfuromonas sp.]|nr:MAG: hypothetical protein C0614_03910 [Desulfuromonas sp.]
MRIFKNGKPAHSEKRGVRAFFVISCFLPCEEQQEEKIMQKKLSVILASILAFGLAVPALAQETTLAPVVVTATKVSQPLAEAPASVTVVSAAEIAERGATRLDELLQDVVGLRVVSSGTRGSLSSASIRGSEASQVLVLIDGVRLNSAQYGQFDLNQLPVSVNAIERIEVLRGPASALYGSNALGGVINIVTQDPEATPSNQVGWMEGRFDTRIINLASARRLGSFRYRVGLEGQESDGYRDNSELEQYTISALFGYAPAENVDLELSAYHLDYQSGIPGAISWPSPQAEQDDRRTLVSLKLEAPAGPFQFTARGLYEDHRNEYRDPGGWMPIDETHKVETKGIELQVAREHDGHSLLVGADYYSDDLDSTTIGSKDQGHGALLAQYQTELTTALTLLVGLRYDIHDEFDNEFSPRATLQARLSEVTRLRFSAGRAFRAPTLNDLYWPADDFSRGNPDLAPETAWEYELALEQQLGGSGRAMLAAFLRDADDLISWQPDENFVYSPVNVNEARIWGVEMESSYELCPSATFGGNYTYLHPKDRASDTYLTGKPRHEAHAYLVLKPFTETIVRFDGRYLRYYPDANRTHKDYFVADLAITRAIMLGTVAVDATLSIKNLLDRDYQANPGYPMPPREWFAGLTAHF